MSTFKELIEKTSLGGIVFVKSINEYVTEKGVSYWSVDVEVKGVRQPIKLNLPKGFDRSKIKEYELAKVAYTVKPTFDGKGINLEALGFFPVNA